MPPFPVGLVTMGLDVGQRQDPTAIAIVQTEARPTFLRDLPPERQEIARQTLIESSQPYAGPVEMHHVVRWLRRLPLGTPYPGVVREVLRLVNGAINQTGGQFPRLFVDATGVGLPVVDMLREARVPAHMWPCYFVHGEHKRWVREGERDARGGRRDMRPISISLGKAYLVARLQALFQTGRIHLPNSADRTTREEQEQMRRELATYEVRTSEQASQTFGAFETGAHDDMVTALGLATLDDLPPAGEHPERPSRAIVPVVV